MSNLLKCVGWYLVGCVVFALACWRVTRGEYVNAMVDAFLWALCFRNLIFEVQS